MNTINSYPSIYTIGHRAIESLFSSPVIVEEKIDGSQFSMSRQNGELVCRSKGQQIIIDAPQKLFIKAIEAAKTLDLKEGWVYRCEYLNMPKHNTLEYSRTPIKNLIIFDICIGLESYLAPEDKVAEAKRIGLEVVPIFYNRKIDSPPDLLSLLEKESILGGVKIEGFVVKNYSQFTPEKKVAIGKFVSEDFKEKHNGEWKKSNPGKKDVVDNLIAQLKTDARWNKAIQHFRDDGKLTNSPKDIGPLLKEIQEDILKEESEFIREQLWKHFWPAISRGIIGGFPEYYKEKIKL